MADLGEEPFGAPVSLRVGTIDDAGAAARLHAGSITDGFLAQLGPRFLRHLYRRVARSPESFLLVAEGDGAVAGFLAGSVDLRALYRRFLVRDGVAAAASSAPRLLGAWPRVWETLRHGAGGHGARGPGSDGPDAGPEAELLAVAVDQAWRGRHVGALLVDGFLGELDRRAVTGARVVVGADNGPAIALYERAGFRTVERFELHRGTPSVVMRRRGTPPATVSGAGAADAP